MPTKKLKSNLIAEFVAKKTVIISNTAFSLYLIALNYCYCSVLFTGYLTQDFFIRDYDIAIVIFDIFLLF